MQNLHELVEVPPEILAEGKKVFLAFPHYREVHPLTMFSLLAMGDRRRMAYSLSFGDAFVAHARAKLATQFLSSKLEWMVMVDSDMVLPFGDAGWFNHHTKLNLPVKFAGMNTVDRLLSLNKTLVGATYFGRSKGAPAVFGEGKKLGELILTRGPVDEVRPTRWVGTGCILIHRSVLLDIEKKFPHLSRAENGGIWQGFTSSEHDLHNAVEECLKLLDGSPSPEKLREILEAGIYKSKVHSALGVGEDVQMCVRATQAGHQPHIDLGLWCAHVGDAMYPIR